MYNHKAIEKKWQDYWYSNNTFKVTNKSDKKFYVLDMFPYPSGSGLHVGHPKGYTATDIIARYKRLKSFDVLHPIGWDAFGLPAEQYALKTGNHPARFTKENINNFRKQLKSLGFSYDYEKEVDTTDPAYFKTTQWIFIQLYKKGLAEIRNIDVNWCEKLGTVLANEEIIILKNGQRVSERGEYSVIKKPMKQWVLKITEYANRLFESLDELDWPSSLVALQKNWIKNEDGSLHLQDWIFSRQRYWGEPFPVAFNEAGEIMIIEDLPLELPHMDKIELSKTGESPLVNKTDWLYFEIDGKKYRRETNTMPQWAGSCWYYIAYILKQPNGYLDIESKKAKTLLKKWLPVDLYVGGQEHAVLHLLYARFWHKVLYDLNLVPTKEPFFKIVNQGMILGPDGQKMSKSKGNVINPKHIINEYGADTLRVYEMFMGPFEDTKPWNEEGVKGIRRWLERVYVGLTEVANIVSIQSNLTSEYNKLIKETTENIEKLKFNIVISKMMVFINVLYKKLKITKQEVEGFLVLFSTFAPHLAEELLKKFKFKSIDKQIWPMYRAMLINKEVVMIAIQVNGKLRGKLEINGNESKEALINLAKENSNVKKFITGKIVKEVYVPYKIINIVVK